MFVLGAKHYFTWKQSISQCLGFDFNAEHIFRKNAVKITVLETKIESHL